MIITSYNLAPGYSSKITFIVSLFARLSSLELEKIKILSIQFQIKFIPPPLAETTSVKKVRKFFK